MHNGFKFTLIYACVNKYAGIHARVKMCMSVHALISARQFMLALRFAYERACNNKCAAIYARATMCMSVKKS